MASDIILLLESDHRRLLALADQSRRRARGLADPAGELRRLLHAHACGVAGDVLGDRVVAGAVVGFEPLTPSEVAAIPEPELAEAARELVEAEAVAVLPALAEGVPLPERRRVGKVYRTRRDARLRAAPRPRRRELSQSEVYELARRAGIQHRSRMTLAQLLAAVGAVNDAADDQGRALMGLLESIGYGIRKGLLLFFGPARLDEAHDPVRRLEHEHEMRVAKEHGTPAPPAPDEPFSGGPAEGTLPGTTPDSLT